VLVREMINTEFSSGILKGSEHLRVSGVDGRIILVSIQATQERFFGLLL